MARKKAPVGSLLKRGLRRTFIREWREHRNLTLESLASQVAELLGNNFSVSQLSRIENAKSPYTQRNLEAIAEALRCKPNDLTMRNPADPESAWSLLESLPPEDRARATQFIEALKATHRRTGTDG